MFGRILASPAFSGPGIPDWGLDDRPIGRRCNGDQHCFCLCQACPQFGDGAFQLGQTWITGTAPGVDTRQGRFGEEDPPVVRGPVHRHFGIRPAQGFQPRPVEKSGDFLEHFRQLTHQFFGGLALHAFGLHQVLLSAVPSGLKRRRRR